jgi:hypothetical protein
MGRTRRAHPYHTQTFRETFRETFRALCWTLNIQYRETYHGSRGQFSIFSALYPAYQSVVLRTHTQTHHETYRARTKKESFGLSKSSRTKKESFGPLVCQSPHE